MRHSPVRRICPVHTLVLLAAVLVVGACATASLAVTQLKRGTDAPPISLKDQNGAEVSSAKLKGHTVVLIFGEPAHEKTRQAYASISTLLRDERLAGEPIVTVLITTQEAQGEDVKAWPGGQMPPTVARDPERSAFGAFQVTVMPSVVVIDREGHIVHAIAGANPRMADMVADSLLFACGKVSQETLDKSLSQESVPSTQAGEKELRADRIAELARQLRRRGLSDLASEKYREALELNPKHVGARLGLGMLSLSHSRVAEAETQFQAVLADQPDSVPASLGLAYVLILRGGSDLDQADKIVRGVLARSPSEARPHYLMGLIYEQRSKPTEAAASFKKATELLLDRVEQD